MADSDIQALLDADGMGTGIRIVRRGDDTGTLSNYFCTGGATYPGKARWVQVTTANTDAQKNTAIRAALAT